MYADTFFTIDFQMTYISSPPAPYNILSTDF